MCVSNVTFLCTYIWGHNYARRTHGPLFPAITAFVELTLSDQNLQDLIRPYNYI